MQNVGHDLPWLSKTITRQNSENKSCHFCATVASTTCLILSQNVPTVV